MFVSDLSVSLDLKFLGSLCLFGCVNKGGQAGAKVGLSLAPYILFQKVLI